MWRDDRKVGRRMVEMGNGLKRVNEETLTLATVWGS